LGADIRVGSDFVGIVRRITKQSAQGCQGKVIQPYTINSSRTSSTTPIHWVRAPPGRRAPMVQFIGVATARRYMTDEAIVRAVRGAFSECLTLEKDMS
jgi:hypothetical protein